LAGLRGGAPHGCGQRPPNSFRRSGSQGRNPQRARPIRGRRTKIPPPAPLQACSKPSAPTRASPRSLRRETHCGGRSNESKQHENPTDKIPRPCGPLRPARHLSPKAKHTRNLSTNRNPPQRLPEKGQFAAYPVQTDPFRPERLLTFFRGRRKLARARFTRL